jgi:hypothetical protein
MPPRARPADGGKTASSFSALRSINWRRISTAIVPGPHDVAVVVRRDIGAAELSASRAANSAADHRPRSRARERRSPQCGCASSDGRAWRKISAGMPSFPTISNHPARDCRMRQRRRPGPSFGRR